MYLLTRRLQTGKQITYFDSVDVFIVQTIETSDCIDRHFFD